MSNQHSVFNRHHIQLRAGLEGLIRALVLLIASVFLIRMLNTPAPIYASDEYAYLKHGQDFGRSLAMVQLRDPGLQGLSNYIYSWMIHSTGRISGDPTPVIRVLNFICYFAGIPLVAGWFLKRHSGGSAHLWFIGLLALLPSSVFILSPMPEILFATIYTIIAVATAVRISPAPLVTSLLAGVGLSVLAYIKPHAVAAIIGFGTFFSVYSIRKWHTCEWRRRLLPLSFTLSVGVGIFIVNAITLRQLSFAPTFVGSIYTGAVQSTFSRIHLLEAAPNILQYVLLHSLILIVIFPLAFAGSIRAIFHLFCNRDKTSCDVADNLAILTTISAAAFIAMIAHFTHYAGGGGASESNRLLGRYLIVLFPSLLLISCYVLSLLESQSTTRLSRLLRNRWVIGAFALIVMGTALHLSRAKLFPWDYPELFSLYSKANQYWGWEAPLSLRTPVFTAGFIVLAAALTFPRYAPRLLVSAQAAFFATSLLLVMVWQETHARTNAPIAAASRILRAEVGPEAEDLLLIGNARYGDVSYALCGLLANPWVKILPNDAELAGSMIPSGVKFVATLGSYKVKFPFVSYTENGPLRVYGLDASTIHTYSAPVPFCNGKELVIHTGNNQRNAALFGFNPPEPWGAWTSDDEAVLLLPCQIQGHLHLKFRCWVQTAAGSSVALTVGDTRLSFQPGTIPTEFDLPISLASPADRIRVYYPATRVNPWERRIGVALSEIAISPEH
jgi:hypothetical protein